MIRFYNATIMDFQGDCNVRTGEVWTDGGKIVYTGGKRSERREFEREVDCSGKLLMPGLKNAHTHSAMTFLRSFADDLPLLDWLHKQVFPREAKLTGEDCYWLTKLAVLEYLSGGTTAIFEMYFYPEEVARAVTECGMRTVFVGGINDYSGEVDVALSGLEQNYHRFNAYHPLVSYRLGFHAEYTTSRPMLEGVAALSAKYGAPVFTHNSEGKPEVEDCLARTGLTPTRYLDELGVYEHGGGGYHCVWMSEEDLEIFRRKKLYAVTNPSSNLKLASGIAPLTEFLRRDIPIAVGTDGPASNNSLDLFKEMFLCTALQKYRNGDAAAMPADRVLEMAVKNGAYAMGLEHCDGIYVGAKADLILIDLMRPNMQPVHNIAKNLVYAGNRADVCLTMIDGRILYENGEYRIGCSPEEIYRRCASIARRLTQD